MDKVTEYRSIAAKFRDEAMKCTLPQRRQLALSAAERWDALAADIETAIAPAVALGGRRGDWVY